jgi:hypothetical protein
MTCRICDAEEGELHNFFWCILEICPFCGGNLCLCDCIYDMCGLRSARYQEKHAFLSREVWRNGPPNEICEEFKTMVLHKGRVPYRLADDKATEVSDVGK